MKFEHANHSEEIPRHVRLLLKDLETISASELDIEQVEGTYVIDADAFELSFVATDDAFEIRNIDTHGNAGLGGRLIRAIHNFVDDNELDVFASNVKDEAIGFWQKMGYQEGSEEGEYYRVG